MNKNILIIDVDGIIGLRLIGWVVLKIRSTSKWSRIIVGCRATHIIPILRESWNYQEWYLFLILIGWIEIGLVLIDWVCKISTHSKKRDDFKLVLSVEYRSTPSHVTSDFGAFIKIIRVVKNLIIWDVSLVTCEGVELYSTLNTPYHISSQRVLELSWVIFIIHVEWLNFF